MSEKKRTIIARLQHRFKLGGVYNDDFDWRTYNQDYRGEIEDLEKELKTRLAPGDYKMIDGTLVLQASGAPLHANHRLLYETILQLAPQSATEVGCGGGDHLANIGVLAPHIALAGVDRSLQQLEFLRQRSPHLSTHVSQVDIIRRSPAIPEAELCYTQAVIMHLQTDNHHLTALANVFRAARRHVVLMENWKKHEFVRDLQMLHAQGRIAWPQLNLYFRRSPELGNRPHLLVASTESLPLERLQDDDTLARTVS